MAKPMLIKMLNADFSRKYLIDKRSPSNKLINLDLVPNVYKGSHTIPNALCRNGLVCTDVTDNWKTFDRNSSILTRST